jgi:DNA-binding GntR family transcriptional regulator
MKASDSQDKPTGTVERVYGGILGGLGQGRLVPGQRLVETELATRFGVGRNAVREAIQRLAARGIVDLSRHRSPSIRRMEGHEALEVLEVASVLTGLVLRTAALRFDAVRHARPLDDAEAALEAAAVDDEPGNFGRARRALYRLLLDIGGNRELQRLFPAIGMDIMHAQYPTRQLRGIRLADYREMLVHVRAQDGTCAEAAAHEHVERVRAIIAARVNAELGQSGTASNAG